MFITCSIIIATFYVGYFLLQHNQSSIDISQRLKQISHSLTLWRCFVFAVVIIWWPQTIAALNHHLQLSSEAVTYLLSKRWHTLTFILLFEICIAYNMLAVLVDKFHQMI